MNKVSVIAKITAKDGQRDELAAALQPMIDHVEANEPDTLRYILMADAGDPNLLWFYEEYTSGEALAAHGASDAMKELGMAVRDFSAARPEIIVCNPIGGKGLD
jgi:quinol monooxygenase YgiN